MQIVKNGLLTGLVLQLAVGPVFFFIVNLTLQSSVFDGLIAVFAVTLVDYLYIGLALLGVGKMLEKKKLKKIVGFFSSFVLILFGGFMIKGFRGVAMLDNGEPVPAVSNVLKSFSAPFFLTLSNPMTIVFFSGLFVAKAVEYSYQKRELFIFGLATGAATGIFLGTAVLLVGFIGNSIPLIVVQLLNGFVGVLLIGYGIVRLVKLKKNGL